MKLGRSGLETESEVEVRVKRESRSKVALWVYAILFFGLIGFAAVLHFGEEPIVDPECRTSRGIVTG